MFRIGVFLLTFIVQQSASLIAARLLEYSGLIFEKMRSGIRIIGHRGHPEVKDALIRFAKWLRNNYEFPIKVPVYLRPERQLITIHGERCSATFFAPWDKTVEPYIRIATGDYEDNKKQRGRDNALAGYLASLAHEIIHYQQWIKNNDLSERGVAVKASNIVDKYALTVDHP